MKTRSLSQGCDGSPCPLACDFSPLRLKFFLFGKGKGVFYFAYGSNMNWEQMKLRCPSARFVNVACLPDHRFAITRQSRRRKCGTADVLPQRGSEVWGIVYEIAESDLAALDGFEDGYRREKRFVYASGDGHIPIEVLVYIAEKESDPPLPNAEYKRLIIEGAKHRRLPQPYLEMLEKIQATDSAIPKSEG